MVSQPPTPVGRASAGDARYISLLWRINKGLTVRIRTEFGLVKFQKKRNDGLPDWPQASVLRDRFVLPPVAVECNMTAILPYLRDAVFEKNDIAAMSMALDDVCKALNLLNENPAREVIAERIIALARNGERSPTLLRDRVLREAGLAEDGATDGNGAAIGDGAKRPTRWTGL
jgi:hypothetical protein